MMKPTIEPGEAVLSLPAALDLAVFEQAEGCLFRPVGAMPGWFPFTPGDTVDLCDRFPMLDLFLPQCDPDWHGVSDLWTEPTAEDRELYLQAIATVAGGRHYPTLSIHISNWRTTWSLRKRKWSDWAPNSRSGVRRQNARRRQKASSWRACRMRFVRRLTPSSE
jgi:hypothetical protein